MVWKKTVRVVFRLYNHVFRAFLKNAWKHSAWQKHFFDTLKRRLAKSALFSKDADQKEMTLNTPALTEMLRVISLRS